MTTTETFQAVRFAGRLHDPERARQNELSRVRSRLRYRLDRYAHGRPSMSLTRRDLKIVLDELDRLQPLTYRSVGRS